MLNLLAAEKIKLMQSKKLWIVLGIFFILPIYQVVIDQVNVHYGAELSQPLDTVVNGATGILMMEKNGLAILLIMSAFVSFFVGEEFQHGTIRNALSLGRSRTHYYLSKLATAGVFTLVGVILLTLVGVASYSLVYGFGGIEGIQNYMIFTVKTFTTLYFLVFSTVSIYVMIGFMTKSSGASLIWSFLYTIGTGFGAGIFQQTENFKEVTYWFTESYLFYADFADATGANSYLDMTVVSLITLVISSTIGILHFKLSDIK